MPITPINRIKSSTSFINKNKTASEQATYGVGYYGVATYGVGSAVGLPINRDKSPNGVITITAGQSMGLLLSITYPTTFNIGTGWINKTKN